MPTLQCPICGTSLTVSENAPAELICPRCLGHIDNSSAMEERRPLPVMPLEHETRRDEAGSGGGIVVVAILMALGAVGLFLAQQPAAGVVVLALALVIVIALVMVAPFKQRSAVLGEAATQSVGAGDDVLQYRSPATNVKAPTDTARTVGLFVLGLVGTPIAVVVLGRFIPVLTLGVPVAGIVFACIPGYRAVGAGILSAFGLCLLILLSICGAMMMGR